MTLYKLLRQTWISGAHTLHFAWADRTVAVPTRHLLNAISEFVGEDEDEHTREDWIEESRDWLKRMREGSESEQVIGHIVWCLNLSREWEDYATRAIYKAVAEALLETRGV